MNTSLLNIAQQLIANRCSMMPDEGQSTTMLPSKEGIDILMHLIAQLVFPSVYAPYGTICDEIYCLQLTGQLAHQVQLQIEAVLGRGADVPSPEELTHQFMSQLPSIQNLLYSDVEAVAHNDPAVTSRAEIISCYPAITVMLHYRVAHALHQLGVPLLPRMMTERAHSLTGVDIHPAAQIGAFFGIDHGTGIVIGATAIIGHHVMIYQGVTLGARNFSPSKEGVPLNLPRHPIIEDRVTIYSNSTILGRIRIGHDSVIGGNLWITTDVAPYSKLSQHTPNRLPADPSPEKP